MKNRIRVREARKQLSTLLNSGKAHAIGGEYQLHGFIVGMKPHERWSFEERRKALKEAKAQFTAAWIAEAKE